MWELWEMQFPHMFAKTEAKMLQFNFGREKWLKKNHPHFDQGKEEHQMNQLTAEGAELAGKGGRELMVEGESVWGTGSGGDVEAKKSLKLLSA